MKEFVWVPTQNVERQKISIPWIIELDAVTERGNPLSTFGYLTYNYDIGLAVYSFRLQGSTYGWHSECATEIHSMDDAIRAANRAFASQNYINRGAPHNA